LELVAKPRLIRESTGDVKYPDVVVHRASEEAIGITELKLPRAKLVARRGKLIYQTAAVTAGVAQVHEYAEIAVDASHASQMTALFGRPVPVTTKSLVIGMSAGVDPDELNKIRSQINGVDLQTWDSAVADAMALYSRNGSGEGVPYDAYSGPDDIIL
jgi:hypothetical protein